MTKDAGHFVEEWVANNIHATGYEEEGDMRAAKAAAFEMLAAADKAGVARAAVEAVMRHEYLQDVRRPAVIREDLRWVNKNSSLQGRSDRLAR